MFGEIGNHLYSLTCETSSAIFVLQIDTVNVKLNFSMHADYLDFSLNMPPNTWPSLDQALVISCDTIVGDAASL